jgi:hypothetical protein
MFLERIVEMGKVRRVEKRDERAKRRSGRQMGRF